MPSRLSELADPAVRLSELHQAADDFDQISRRVGERYPAAEFVAVVQLELLGPTISEANGKPRRRPPR